MSKKAKSLFITAMVYVIALVVAVVGSYQFLGLHQWLLVLIGHLFATVVVFIASQLYKNSSLYDPFWSVAPIPIAIYVAFWPESSDVNIEKVILILIPFMFWALRLTANWMRDWVGLEHEDFRYIDLKNTNKFKAEFNNFFGIHLFPTLIVNLGLFPLLFILTNSISVNIYLYLASIFTFLAVVLETVADEQMREFRSNPLNTGKTMKYKLWKFSRHPNYLGEILFWYGIFFMGLSSGLMPYWTLICPTAMLALFVLASCPMMDERSLKNRSDYKEYMEKTSMLLLLPPKN